MTRLVLAMGIALACGGAAGARSQAPAKLADLVETERAFARAAVTGGVQAALLEYLADGAIVLRPQLVGSRTWAPADRPAAVTLAWWPVWGVVSEDGTLGCTAGPWEYGHGEDSLTPASYGDHASVWKKQKDGAWRVVLDLGTMRPRTRRADDSRSWPESVPAPRGGTVDVAAEREGLLALDRAFDGATREGGTVEAYERVAAKDIRLFRGDHFPAVGWSAARKVLLGTTGSQAWEPRVAEVAASGDLGYTFGSVQRSEDNTASSASYVRVWRRDEKGAWRLQLEMQTSAPPRK